MTRDRLPAEARKLGRAGRDLWRRWVGYLPDGWEFDGVDTEALLKAGAAADDVARLEELRAAAREAGDGREERLLSDAVSRGRKEQAAHEAKVRLPVEGRAMSAASLRAQRAAQSRWERTKSIREGRRGSA